MFHVTALGHHSWLFESGGTRLLVDPLLTEAWGFTPEMGLRVWPPRALDLDQFPPIDAVLITHEHEGHFEIPSLLQLDRRVPIYISHRSSLALRRFLTELGFEVRLVLHDSVLNIGALRVHVLCPSHLIPVADEWDVMPYLVMDQDGHGSFFTHVDSVFTDALWQRCRELLPRPGLFALTTNHNNFSLLYDTEFMPDRHLQLLVSHFASLCRDLTRHWGPAAAWLMVGQGFCFGGDQAFLNGAGFPFSIDEAQPLVQALTPDTPLIWPSPGSTLTMQNGELIQVQDCPFARSLPRTDWPKRSYGDPAWLEDYAPATGQRSLNPQELEALQVELDRFAAFLHIRKMYRAGLGVSEDVLAGREPTIAIVARVDDGAYVWAYEPQGCRFVPSAHPDPVARYAGVFEAWGRDLLAVLRAEVSANTLLFGRSRGWQPLPLHYPVNLLQEILRYVHPLRHPQRFGALYEAVRARHADLAPRLRFNAPCSP